MYSWAPVDVPVVPPSKDVPDQLSLFDTAAGAVVPVGPDSGEARLYVCGITPYDATHLGHASTYLAFDMVVRQWRDLGLAVNYTQNVTDVDDPLLERAARTGQEWDELAADQIELFRTDMQSLRVVPPDHYVGAVEAIPSVVALVQQLDETDLVYQVDDPEHPDWYFNTVAAPGFGSLSKLDEQQMLAVFKERGGDPDRPGKRHPLDCLLWQFARPGEPSWGSPLGAGRPGWHIECAAIALDRLGKNFDVQGGGSDLVFPHHEMCAAEVIVAVGEPMARAYVHTGMVALDGQKMSKSLGNLELVSRLRQQGADPMAIRLALLDNHYRDDWEWTPDLLERATKRLAAWRDMTNDDSAMPAEPLIAELRRCLRNDLDTKGALAAVDAWVAGSLAMDSDDAMAVQQVVAAVDALLGVKL